MKVKVIIYKQKNRMGLFDGKNRDSWIRLKINRNTEIFFNSCKPDAIKPSGTWSCFLFISDSVCFLTLCCVCIFVLLSSMYYIHRYVLAAELRNLGFLQEMDNFLC